MSEPAVLTVLTRLAQVPVWHRFFLETREIFQWSIFVPPGMAEEVKDLNESGFNLHHPRTTGARAAYLSGPDADEFLRSISDDLPYLKDVPGRERKRLMDYFLLTHGRGQPLAVEELNFLLDGVDALVVFQDDRELAAFPSETIALQLAADRDIPGIEVRWPTGLNRGATAEADCTIHLTGDEAKENHLQVDPFTTVPAPSQACTALVFTPPEDDPEYRRLLGLCRELAGELPVGIKPHPDHRRQPPSQAHAVTVGPADLLPLLAAGTPVFAAGPLPDIEFLCRIADTSMQVLSTDRRIDPRVIRQSGTDSRTGKSTRQPGTANADVWNNLRDFIQGWSK